MPFAFSTLGCPERTIEEVLQLATSRGVDGLELRAAPGTTVSTELDPAARVAIRDACAAAGVRVLTVASYLRICEPGDDEAFVRAVREHLALAADLGARYVRIFPGAAGGGAAGDARAVRRLLELAPAASAVDVRIALETHDSHPRGADLAGILGALDEQLPGHGVQAIWDVLHPWRAGEGPAESLGALAQWLAYVQIKDADVGPAGALRLVGEGHLPLDEIATLLEEYDDLWWSLEWEKLWHPELSDLPEALDGALEWFRHTVAQPG